MKDFFKKEWKQPGTQLLTWFLVFFAVVWCTFWSIQQGSLNLYPLLYAVGAYVFVWLLSYIFRNNP